MPSHAATCDFLVQLGLTPCGEYRQTPEGNPTVKDLCPVGSVITTNYDTGPYIVRSVTEYFIGPEGGYPSRLSCWSLAMCLKSEPRKKADYFINELVAVHGRLLKLFVANTDEIFVQRKAELDVAVRMKIAEPSLFDWLEEQSNEKKPM